MHTTAISTLDKNLLMKICFYYPEGLVVEASRQF